MSAALLGTRQLDDWWGMWVMTHSGPGQPKPPFDPQSSLVSFGPLGTSKLTDQHHLVQLGWPPRPNRLQRRPPEVTAARVRADPPLPARPRLNVSHGLWVYMIRTWAYLEVWELHQACRLYILADGVVEVLELLGPGAVGRGRDEPVGRSGGHCAQSPTSATGRPIRLTPFLLIDSTTELGLTKLGWTKWGSAIESGSPNLDQSGPARTYIKT